METIPLFPLGTVLFPGMMLPLRIFEPRYRALMERLLALPDGTPREFGVVAIRQGWEVGVDGVSALYPVGCTARLRRVEQFEDGTYEIVTVGFERFRIESLEPDAEPYLEAKVERLPTELGSPAEAEVLAQSVTAVFRDYIGALAGSRVTDFELPDLPQDPLLLSALVAVTAQLELGDRQSVLAARDGVARLRAELRLLRTEATMLRQLRAVPVPLAELQVPYGLN